MSETDMLEGGCSCNAVRYRLLASPLIVHCCHCSWCQRESGSAFAINALVELACLQRRSGEVEVVPTPSASGDGQTITRCAVCKVALWSQYAMPLIGDSVGFVRVGTLDSPDKLPPDVHIFTSTRQAWLSLGDSVPAFPQYYRARDVWPEASLARRRALINAASSKG